MNLPAPRSSIALHLTGLCKSFGSTPAVDDVDLDVADGELVALVGPSGCGKSTLLRIVAGLTAADRGRVEIGGVLVEDGTRHADPEHRDVGLVFQEHSLFPHLSVGGNITFGLRAISRSERQQRCDTWLDMIGLPGCAGRYPHELSGGERQRVALARALAPEPRLMLLDEPFASLDPNLRSQLRADVIEILRASGTAAVIVTHDQSEALAIGDRIAVMRSGRIDQLDTPDAVFHHPSNRFVATFMGDASFLPLDRASRSTELGPTATFGAVGDGQLAVVRPTDVIVHFDGDAPSDAPKAQVVASEFRGETRSYTMRLASGTLVRCTQPSAVELQIGSTVQVSISPGPHAVVPAD